MPDEADFLTVAEFARRAGLSRQEVYKLIWNGRIPHVYFGRSLRIPRAYLAYTVAVALAGGASLAAVPSGPSSDPSPSATAAADAVSAGN
jgi:excisionase family DNA binding protein